MTYIYLKRIIRMITDKMCSIAEPCFFQAISFRHPMDKIHTLLHCIPAICTCPAIFYPVFLMVPADRATRKLTICKSPHIHMKRLSEQILFKAFGDIDAFQVCDHWIKKTFF